MKINEIMLISFDVMKMRQLGGNVGKSCESYRNQGYDRA